MRTKRLLAVLALAACITLPALAQPDPTTPVGQLTQREMFQAIFSVNDAIVDSAKAWYRSHASLDPATVDSDSLEVLLFDDVLSLVKARLRGLEEQYKLKQVASTATTF